MNINLSKAANNDFEKDFFKLINNSFFGKTMRNVRKLRDKTCNNRKEKKLFGV